MYLFIYWAGHTSRGRQLKSRWTNLFVSSFFIYLFIFWCVVFFMQRSCASWNKKKQPQGLRERLFRLWTCAIWWPTPTASPPMGLKENCSVVFWLNVDHWPPAIHRVQPNRMFRCCSAWSPTTCFALCHVTNRALGWKSSSANVSRVSMEPKKKNGDESVWRYGPSILVRSEIFTVYLWKFFSPIHEDSQPPSVPTHPTGSHQVASR